MAKGRIFALGDCVKVLDAMRFTKDIYPAEAMVEVVVANLRALKRCKEVKKGCRGCSPESVHRYCLVACGGWVVIVF